MQKTKGQIYFEALHGWETLDAAARLEWEQAAPELSGEVAALEKTFRIYFENNPTIDRLEMTADDVVSEMRLVGTSRAWGRHLTKLVGSGCGQKRILNGFTFYVFCPKDF